MFYWNLINNYIDIEYTNDKYYLIENKKNTLKWGGLNGNILISGKKRVVVRMYTNSMSREFPNLFHFFHSDLNVWVKS